MDEVNSIWMNAVEHDYADRSRGAPWVASWDGMWAIWATTTRSAPTRWACPPRDTTSWSTTAGGYHGTLEVVLGTLFNPLDTLWNIPGMFVYSVEAIAVGVWNTFADILSMLVARMGTDAVGQLLGQVGILKRPTVV